MSSGFRRSLARHAGRTIAALAIVAIGALSGVAPAAPSAARLLPATGRDTIQISAGEPGDQARAIGSAVDLAAFGPVAADELALDATAGLQPSIQYEEAEKHATDRIPFTLGARVTVGFQPRAGDAWEVGGVRPTALPAGRLDGRAIHGQGQPSAPDRRSRTPATIPPGGGASVDPGPPAIDEPGNDTLVDGTNASVRGPATSGPEGTVVGPDAAISAKGLRREIFGFLPYWELNSSSLRLDHTKISTIAYFGVGADGAGNLQKRNADGTTTVGWSGWTSSKLTSVITAAHASHTRVVLTVQSFGWNTSGLNRQMQLLGSSTNRLNLARQIAVAVRDRGVDGVNLDFEPLAATYDAEFTALVRAVRAELNKIQSGYQITFDTTGSIGNYPIANATASGGADAVFIMGYDYRSAGSSPVGSIAPLTKTGYDIRDTIVAYTAKVAPSKLILGVPYYGRAWSTSSSAINATNLSGTKYGASTTVVYDTAADYLAQYGRRYDAAEGVAWTAYQRENCSAADGCVTSWRQLYVDDATAIGAKYDLVNTYGLRGAGIWALGYDGARPELWAAIQRKFVTDTTPPTSGVKTLSAVQLNPGFSVAWTGRDDVAVASFDVQVSTDGGAWTAWQNATKAGSAPYYGIDSHTYAFRVRARDPKGNVSAWNVTESSAAAGSGLAVGGFGVVRVDGLSIRSSADTSGTKVGTFDLGAIVAVIAGPRSADGYAWYQVRGPLKEWAAVTPLGPQGWVAATSSGSTLVAPAKAPNATRIGAAIGDLFFGNAGPASLGSAVTATAHRALSPNGDGSGDTLAIDWTNDRALDSLALRVFKGDGTLVGNVPLSQLGAGTHEVKWNGRVGSTILPNGRYLIALVGADAGATYFDPSPTFLAGSLATYGVTIDTVAPVVSSASASASLISPDGDGIRDAVTVRLAATGADHWTFSAAPLSGTTVGPAVATAGGAGGSAAWTWTGRTTAAAGVADGLYRLTLTALDPAGNRVARAWTLRVDDTAAILTSSAAPALFSPNGDGVTESTRLAWASSERITGTARIYRATTLIRSWAVTSASAGAITWLGSDAAGRAVADGRYAFRIAGRDAAGNMAVSSAPVVIDRTLSAVRWNRAAFYPQDGDALLSTAAVSFSLTRAAIVTIGIYSGPILVRTAVVDRSLAAGAHSWTWDGRDAKGAFVARATYVARVAARSWIGTAIVSRAVTADAFRTALSATSVRAGQTLTVIVTTTEGLRSAPRITFVQPGRAGVIRTAVSLGSGRYRATFTVASGAAGIGTLGIAARDTANGLNTSTAKVTIR